MWSLRWALQHFCEQRTQAFGSFQRSFTRPPIHPSAVSFPPPSHRKNLGKVLGTCHVWRVWGLWGECYGGYCGHRVRSRHTTSFGHVGVFACYAVSIASAFGTVFVQTTRTPCTRCETAGPLSRHAQKRLGPRYRSIVSTSERLGDAVDQDQGCGPSCAVGSSIGLSGDGAILTMGPLSGASGITAEPLSLSCTHSFTLSPRYILTHTPSPSLFLRTAE